MTTGFPLLKALNNDPADLIKAAERLGVGLDSLADFLADSSVIVDADPGVLRPLRKLLGDIIEAEETTIRKAGKKMSGERLARLKGLHAGIGDLIGELDDDPNDDPDEMSKGVRGSLLQDYLKLAAPAETKEKTTMTKSATTPDTDPATLLMDLAKARSTLNKSSLWQEYSEVLAKYPLVYQAAQRPPEAPLHKAAATTAPEYEPFEAFTKAAKAPRPGDSRTPFQVFNVYLNTPEGRDAYARYNELHG